MQPSSAIAKPSEPPHTAIAPAAAQAAAASAYSNALAETFNQELIQAHREALTILRHLMAEAETTAMHEEETDPARQAPESNARAKSLNLRFRIALAILRTRPHATPKPAAATNHSTAGAATSTAHQPTPRNKPDSLTKAQHQAATQLARHTNPPSTSPPTSTSPPSAAPNQPLPSAQPNQSNVTPAPTQSRAAHALQPTTQHTTTTPGQRAVA